MIIAELARQLQVEQAADYIRELVDTAPPLTEEQRTRLAALFWGAESPDCQRQQSA